MAWRYFTLTLLGSLLLASCTTSSVTSPWITKSDAPTEVPHSSVSTPTPVFESVPVPVNNSLTPADDRDQQGGGTLVQLFTDPPTLDPHLTADFISGSIVVEVFGGLVTLDPQLKIIPDLAVDWKVSPNGRIYTFNLRPEARFHSGKPVSASDVAWSVDRASDPKTKSPISAQYLGDILGVRERLDGSVVKISGVKVIDENTLQITIDAPKSYFLAKLTYPTAFVLDREHLESHPDNWLSQPNGTGPFMLTEYAVGETIELSRNDSYHLGAPHLEQVTLVLSGGNSVIMYENDEVHLATVGLIDLTRMQDPASALNSEIQQSPPDFRVSYIGLNVEHPPLDDPKVRMALNLAIDRKILASTALQDLVAVSNGIIPPGFPSYNPDLRGYEYNPVLAKQLLLESKYGSNLDKMPAVTLSIPGGFGATISLDVEVIVEAWSKLGVKTEIQQTRWPTFLHDLHNKRFQMFQSGWVADYPDPENFLDVLFHSASPNNHTNYSNPEVDVLLERARVEPDQATRFRTYNHIEQMILDDAPWVPLWNSGDRYTLVKPNVRGYHLTPILLPKLRYVYFTD